MFSGIYWSLPVSLSICPSVYKILVNPFPNKPWFIRVCSTSLLKTLREKEKLLVTSNFSFFPTVFSTLLENFQPFSTNSKLNCHPQTLSVWKSLKFVVWERVNLCCKLLQFHAIVLKLCKYIDLILKLCLAQFSIIYSLWF